MSMCKSCDGFGSVTMALPECCGRAGEFGCCKCDCAVLVERTEPCPDCAGYGFSPIEADSADVEIRIRRKRYA